MESLIDESIAQPRLRTWLLAGFSLMALTLACLGIYAVISYTVSQRVREIGLRIALGAGRDDILQTVLGRAMKLSVAGVSAGLVVALLLSRFLTSLLFGISARDPATFTVAAIVLLAVALLAAYVPANRAAKIDPMISLRYE